MTGQGKLVNKNDIEGTKIIHYEIDETYARIIYMIPFQREKYGRECIWSDMSQNDFKTWKIWLKILYVVKQKVPNTPHNVIGVTAIYYLDQANNCQFLLWCPSDIIMHSCSYIPPGFNIITLRPRQIAAISQTTFSSEFSWIKMYDFRLRFHWSLFLRFELTILQHWFS